MTTKANEEILDYLKAMAEDAEERHIQLMEALEPVISFMEFAQGMMGGMLPNLMNANGGNITGPIDVSSIHMLGEEVAVNQDNEV